MNKKEIEIRFTVSSKQKNMFANFVKTNKLNIKKSVQRDIYLCPAILVNSKRSRESNFILRIRQTKKFCYLTYKSFTGDGSWIEREIIINEPLITLEILEKIGQKKYLTINKRRQSVKYKTFEINLDDIEGLGDFIEIEVLAENVITAQQDLINFAKTNFKTTKQSIIKQGYVQLMENNINNV